MGGVDLVQKTHVLKEYVSNSILMDGARMTRKRLTIQGSHNFLKKYIDEKSKFERLDTALLLFSSSLGFVFTLFYAFFEREQLFNFLPILVPAWFMPIYVGYIRGSLIFDCLEERVRGWIYFAMGGGIYVTIFIYSIINESLAGPTGKALSLIIIILTTFMIGYSVRRIAQAIFEIFGRKITHKADEAFGLTVRSSISLTFLAYFSVYLLSRHGDVLTPGIGGISEMLLFIFLMGFLAFYVWFLEKRARQWTALAIKKS